MFQANWFELELGVTEKHFLIEMIRKEVYLSQRKLIIQKVREEIAKKATSVCWADDDSEMDFSKPMVLETNDMDLSE
jgi:hypothetical protein